MKHAARLGYLRSYRSDYWNGENAFILDVEAKQEADYKRLGVVGWGIRDIESVTDPANMRVE